MQAALRAYIPIAKMLVATFGGDCEVVLHDLQDPEHSVVHVENGRVTGREVGQSFDHLIRQVLLSEQLKDDFVANYFFHAPNGKLIRSSTLLIRDESHALIGALCINLDTTRLRQQVDFLQSFLPDSAAQHRLLDPPAEKQHVAEMIAGLIEQILANCDPCGLSREERLKKIRFMEEKGVFLMKGGVELVAEKLGISSVTVYHYLDVIRGKRQ